MQSFPALYAQLSSSWPFIGHHHGAIDCFIRVSVGKEMTGSLEWQLYSLVYKTLNECALFANMLIFRIFWGIMMKVSCFHCFQAKSLTVLRMHLGPTWDIVFFFLNHTWVVHMASQWETQFGFWPNILEANKVSLLTSCAVLCRQVDTHGDSCCWWSIQGSGRTPLCGSRWLSRSTTEPRWM